VGIEVGLYRYNNFFQQTLHLAVNIL
jgi:hypothetical protein